MANLARLAMKALTFKAKAFERATEDPIQAQRQILLEYTRRNKNTEYGIRYNFSKIGSIQGFQALVPVSGYESLRPYIERMAKGEANILTRDRPVFFGATSGTTNTPKLIPTTRYSQVKKAALMDLWGYYISRDYPNTFDGKILAIVSPAIEGYTESGMPYGAESGYGYRDLPALVKRLYALPYEVFEIQDYDARYYSILRISMEQNITNVATLNPETVILLCQKIPKWQDMIIEDIRAGKLNGHMDIELPIRKAIQRHLRPNHKRADELEAMLKRDGELLPKYFWPKMGIIECWKAGMMGLYLKELVRYFGNIPIRDIGCVSTEARSSIPVSDQGAGGVLAIQTNFYEFMPSEDSDKKEKRILLCDQLEKGKEYFLIVTTAGGLYRYDIDDIITVDGFFNNTPVIEFLQKGSGATSLAGEKLYESQLNKAVSKALTELRLAIEFFAAVTDLEGGPRYVFLVEFSGSPSSDEKRGFLKAVEEELYLQNREYDFVRHAGLLALPVLKVVKNGELERYKIKRISEGAHDAQFKIPQLTTDLNFQKNFVIEEEVRLT